MHRYALADYRVVAGPHSQEFFGDDALSDARKYVAYLKRQIARGEVDYDGYLTVKAFDDRVVEKWWDAGGGKWKKVEW